MIVIDVEGFESEVLSGWKKLSELLLGTRCMMEATCNVEEHIGMLWVGEWDFSDAVKKMI